MRRGFTLIELLLVIGILSVLGSIGTISYRTYVIRSDLDIAAQHVFQGIARAKLLSQSGKDDAQWGFHVQSGTVFQGDTYAGSDDDFHEIYPISPTIVATGLPEVVFAKVSGRPNATGTITLTSLTGETRSIDIEITEEGLATNRDDWITVCHVKGGGKCETKDVQDSSWFGPHGHQIHGDCIGSCLAEDSEPSDGQCDDDDDGDMCDPDE